MEAAIKWEGTRGAARATIGYLMDYPHGVPDTLEVCLTNAHGPGDWQSFTPDGSWFPEAFIGPMAELLRYVEGSSPDLSVSVEDVIRTMACIEAAYRSEDTGGIPLPTIPEDPSKEPDHV